LIARGAGGFTLAGVPFRPAVVAALACLAVAACAGAPSTQTVTNPIPVPSQTQLTGTALKSALLPLSDFPAGYEIDAQETSDTGPALRPGSSASASPPRGCPQMVQSVSRPAGMTAGASEVLYDTTAAHLSSYHQRSYGQIVYQFATVSGSTGYFDSLRSVFSRCASVTTTDGTAAIVIRQTVRPASPVAGHQTLLTRQTDTVDGENVDSVTLYTIDGTDVYELGAAGFGVPPAAQPSSLASLMAKLIARVQAYECALACAQTGEGG
jgi:hypothetical protein